ncbi:MAG: glycosyltransferase family 87 protein [Anaerolineae bacterium]|nr:glycosyltransferase family 87 protein [Anaerolineae bacterium]
MRKLSTTLIVIGLLIAVFFIFSDSLGLGKDAGIGATQILGILVGAAIILLSIGLETVSWGKEVSLKNLNYPNKILGFPIFYWIIFTFLVAYTIFFLFPVFFSKIQIQYLTKYVPNAYITHIGFDIETTVSRIEIWLNTGLSPYAHTIIAYPPLAIAIFSTFSIIGYPAYYKLITSITLLAYFVVTVVISLILAPKKNQPLLMLLFLSGLFSYGFQFELERGQFNMIVFSFCLLGIYIYHFHHKLRFFAYLLITLAIQLKIYPVFFVVMFINDWSDWRNTIRRFIILGLINVSLLFVLGNKLFHDFLNAITLTQLLQSSRYENLSIKGFAYHISNTDSNIFATTGVIEILFFLILGLCFFSVIAHAYLHKTRGLNPYLLLICSIAALIVPSVSNDYKLSILIGPMVLVLSCLPDFFELKRKALLIFLVLLSSSAYWIIQYPATVKPEFLIRNFPALMVILITITIMNFLAPYTIEKRYKGLNN